MDMKDITDRTELAKVLSDISRNSGKVTFKITYTATNGNLDIDKAFQKYCSKFSNNEYLAGIGLLLQAWEHYKDVRSLEVYLQSIDSRLKVLEDKATKDTDEPVNEIKEKKVF